MSDLGETIEINDSVVDESDHSTISGDGNDITTHYSQISGDNSIVRGWSNHVFGDNEVVRGDHNWVHGNNELVIGNRNTSDTSSLQFTFQDHIFGNNITATNCHNVFITGDDVTLQGQASKIYDVHGGDFSISGGYQNEGYNTLYAKRSDSITLSGAHENLNFEKAKIGHSLVVGFITGDGVQLGEAQSYSISESTKGTLLHLGDEGQHYNILFADTSADVVGQSIHGGVKMTA